VSLRIVRLAAGSAFQDGGRPGWRRYGVPPGGAFDRESYRLALALVGRREGAALEIPLLGGAFEAEAPCRLAVAGAGSRIEVAGLNLGSNAAFDVFPGQRVQVGPAEEGARVYLASASAWQIPERLGSASGASPGERLEEIETGDRRPSPARRLAQPPTSLASGPFRVTRGPQGRPEDLQRLIAGPCRVSLRSNRVGIRLEGGDPVAGRELPSEPSCPGAVQLAPSGEWLLHGPDGPTIGGYPKIAVVCQADLDRLAQLRPGAEVSFELVELDEARALAVERFERLEAALRQIEWAAVNA
jgi:5-oxoprolinase (ATP-hydrolysing) subunit C